MTILLCCDEPTPEARREGDTNFYEDRIGVHRLVCVIHVLVLYPLIYAWLLRSRITDKGSGISTELLVLYANSAPGVVGVEIPRHVAVARPVLHKDEVSPWVRTLVRTIGCREGPAWRETGDLHGVNTRGGVYGWDVFEERGRAGDTKTQTHRLGAAEHLCASTRKGRSN